MPGKAPVDKIGGTQAQGPWPEDVEEVAVDERLKRPVNLGNDRVEELEVLVQDIVELERGGHAVSYQFDNPNSDGGGN